MSIDHKNLLARCIVAAHWNPLLEVDTFIPAAYEPELYGAFTDLVTRDEWKELRRLVDETRMLPDATSFHKWWKKESAPAVINAG